MQPVIAEVFHAEVEYLVAGKYVKLENYFVDGTKIEADGNKHKVVWAKRKERYEKAVKEQVNELLKQIEAENEAEEEAEYGERDLEEMGGRNEDVNGERLKKLESNCLPRLEKYEEQTMVLAGRNSYSKTDPDATCMRMKEDRGAERPWVKPAYNVQVGTEG